ncbi:phosphatidylserine decarboxylase family protein, partial [Micromonospora zhanjiangensis]
MTQSPAVRTGGAPGTVRLGERAARTVTAELARHHGPKTGLLVGVTPDSAVLAAALDALLPGDVLTVVPADAAGADDLRDHVTEQGRWVADRVRVVESPAAADPAEVVVLAEPLTGTADEARGTLD